IFEGNLDLHELTARVALLGEVVGVGAPAGRIVGVGGQRPLERLGLGGSRPRRRLDVAFFELFPDQLVGLGPGLLGGGEGLGLGLPGGADLAVRDGEAGAAHLNVPKLVGLRVAVLKRPHRFAPWVRVYRYPTGTRSSTPSPKVLYSPSRCRWT